MNAILGRCIVPAGSASISDIETYNPTKFPEANATKLADKIEPSAATSGAIHPRYLFDKGTVVSFSNGKDSYFDNDALTGTFKFGSGFFNAGIVEKSILAALAPMAAKYDTVGKQRGYNNVAFLKPLDKEDTTYSAGPIASYPNHLKILVALDMSVARAVVCTLKEIRSKKYPILHRAGADPVQFEDALMALAQLPKDSNVTLGYEATLLSLSGTPFSEELKLAVQYRIEQHVKRILLNAAQIELSALQSWTIGSSVGYITMALSSLGLDNVSESETFTNFSRVMGAVDTICVAGGIVNSAVKKRIENDKYSENDAWDRIVALFGGVDLRVQVPFEVEQAVMQIPLAALTKKCEESSGAIVLPKESSDRDPCLYVANGWECYRPKWHGRLDYENARITVTGWYVPIPLGPSEIFLIYRARQLLFEQMLAYMNQSEYIGMIGKEMKSSNALAWVGEDFDKKRELVPKEWSRILFALWYAIPHIKPKVLQRSDPYRLAALIGHKTVDNEFPDIYATTAIELPYSEATIRTAHGAFTAHNPAYKFDLEFGNYKELKKDKLAFALAMLIMVRKPRTLPSS